MKLFKKFEYVSVLAFSPETFVSVPGFPGLLDSQKNQKSNFSHSSFGTYSEILF